MSRLVSSASATEFISCRGLCEVGVFGVVFSLWMLGFGVVLLLIITGSRGTRGACRVAGIGRVGCRRARWSRLLSA